LAPSRSAKIGFAYAPVTACMASNVNLKILVEQLSLNYQPILCYIRDHGLAIYEAYKQSKSLNR